MNPNRLIILGGVAALLFVMLAWHWISGWGLVTVHADAQPLAKIIRSIERQGGIKIVTNADLTVPVSMDLDRVPPVEAVDTLAAWLDGGWTVTYVAGPQKADVVAGIAALQEGGRGNGDFARFGGGGGWGGGGMGGGDTVIDARQVAWSVSPSEDRQLQAWLNQLSQKTGLSVMTPQTWNPAIALVPKGGPAGAAVRDLVWAAKGEGQEVFVMRVSNQDPTADEGRGDGDRANRGPGPATDGGVAARRDSNPEWAAEREQARLAVLPPAEREQAQKDGDMMRETWQKMRDLPPAERQAAIEKIMNDPVVQERMTERMMSRDAKTSPEKRVDRFRQYLQRKQQAKSSS